MVEVGGRCRRVARWSSKIEKGVFTKKKDLLPPFLFFFLVSIFLLFNFVRESEVAAEPILMASS